MGAVNSMTQFQTYFGLSPIGASKTGLVFGIYTVGYVPTCPPARALWALLTINRQVVAFFPASTLPDKIGRRWTMFLGNLVLCMGAILAGLARNMSMLLVGRFFVGLGCSTAAQGGKTYLSEITSPVSRGRWMGLQK